MNKGLERIYNYDIVVKSTDGKTAYVGYITKNHSLKFQKYQLIDDGVLHLEDKEYCMKELKDHMKFNADSLLGFKNE